jgi:hypothetical protein
LAVAHVAALVAADNPDHRLGAVTGRNPLGDKTLRLQSPGTDAQQASG